MKTLLSVLSFVVIIGACTNENSPSTPVKKIQTTNTAPSSPPPPTMEPSVNTSGPDTRDVSHLINSQYKVIVYKREEITAIMNRFESIGNYVGFFFTPIPHSKDTSRMVFKVEAIKEDGSLLSPNAILLDRTAVIIARVESSISNQDPLYVFQDLGNMGFAKEDLQYFTAFQNFDKAFFSKANMKFLFEAGPYIGLSGSFVNSGNIQVIEVTDPNDPPTMTYSRPENYFNLKFAAFEEALKPDRRTVELVIEFLDKNGHDYGYDEDLTMEFLSTSVVPRTSIPATTFSEPCPPRWDEI